MAAEHLHEMRHQCLYHNCLMLSTTGSEAAELAQSLPKCDDSTTYSGKLYSSVQLSSRRRPIQGLVPNRFCAPSHDQIREDVRRRNSLAGTRNICLQAGGGLRSDKRSGKGLNRRFVIIKGFKQIQNPDESQSLYGELRRLDQLDGPTSLLSGG
jgi:hypothetical protein